MNKNNSSENSGTDWERVDAMKDEDIDLSDIPEITEEQMARATLRFGGKPVPKGISYCNHRYILINRKFI